MKCDIRTCGELLQEVSFPFFRITLQFKSPLEFLFLLTLPVGIVEFAVPGIAFIILIAWHVVISPFTPWGGVNIWKIMVLLIFERVPNFGEPPQNSGDLPISAEKPALEY